VYEKHGDPEGIFHEKTSPVIYELIRELKKENKNSISYENLKQKGLTQEKDIQNLLREYNSEKISPVIKEFIDSLDSSLSKQEKNKKIKEHRGEITQKIIIPLDFILKSKSLSGEELSLTPPKKTDDMERGLITTVDFKDPLINTGIQEFRNNILNKSKPLHTIWSGGQRVFSEKNHVMILTLDKNLVPEIMNIISIKDATDRQELIEFQRTNPGITELDLKKSALELYMQNTSHPKISNKLTIGWVRYTLGKDIKKDPGSSEVWIDEVQTDFTKIFGKGNSTQIFPIDKLSYLIMKKFIKFIRSKGFDTLYLPDLKMARNDYDRGNPYVPVYTVIPSKLRFKKQELTNFHHKVDGADVWVHAKKRYPGYTFDM